MSATLPGGPPSAVGRRSSTSGVEPLPWLLDDRGRPDFREAYGMLAQRSSGLDVALTRIRLSTLDLSEAELGRMSRIRLLLSEVSAAALDAEAHAVLHRASMASNLRRLLMLLHLGRIDVRSAPLGGWAPDFSIFWDDARPFALLVGPHRFDRGAAHQGPVLASVHGSRAAVRAASCFRELWSSAHDIRHAIASILVRAEGRAPAPDQGVTFTGSGGPTSTGTTASALGARPQSVDTPLARR